VLCCVVLCCVVLCCVVLCSAEYVRLACRLRTADALPCASVASMVLRIDSAIEAVEGDGAAIGMLLQVCVRDLPSAFAPRRYCIGLHITSVMCCGVSVQCAMELHPLLYTEEMGHDFLLQMTHLTCVKLCAHWIDLFAGPEGARIPTLSAPLAVRSLPPAAYPLLWFLALCSRPLMPAHAALGWSVLRISENAGDCV
jgi:hypothetical protein